jgi:predicted metal-dependent phosphoesterase TrpH
LPLLRLDFHVHTVRSKDAHTEIEDLPRIIKAKGLDGVAITEHDSFDPPSFDDVLIVPGLEITSRDGHVIGLGLHDIISARLPADETIRRIHDQGGVAVIPHPYDPVCECVKLAQLNARPDAVETANADALSFHISNWLARRDAKKFKLPEVGGSDSHIPQSIGDAYTVVDAASRSVEDILDAVRNGRVHAEGHATSIRNKLRKLSYKFR